MKTNVQFHHTISCYDKTGVPCKLEVFTHDNNPFSKSVIMNMTKNGLIRASYVHSRPHVKPAFMNR